MSKKIKEIQRITKIWDKIRREILKHETNIQKVQSRFGITTEEMKKIIQMISLLRIPLSCQKTLEII